MTPKAPFPLISKELAERLNEAYPERCPDPKWTEREVWIAVGERMVVRNLLNHYNLQLKVN